MSKRLLLLTLLLSALSMQSQEVLFDWNVRSGLKDWRQNNAIADLRSEDGVLKGKVVKHDPQLTSPLISYRPAVEDKVAIRLKVSHAGPGQLYYSDNDKPPYEGFNAKQVVDFHIKSSGEWETVVFRPFFSSENPIIHFRLDFPDDVDFEVEYLRITREDAGVLSTDTTWHFEQNKHLQWHQEDGGVLFSPNLKLDAGEYRSLCFNLQTPGQAWVELQVMTDQGGMHSVPLVTSGFDQAPHTYCLNMQGFSFWKGVVRAVALQITTEFAQPYHLNDFAFLKAPWKGSDLEVLFFGAENYPARAGKNNRVLLKLKNLSSEKSSYQARLSIPDGHGMLLEDMLEGDIEGGETVTRSFEVVAKQPGAVHIDAQLSIDGQTPVRHHAKPLEVTPVPRSVQSDYIPEPVPAKTDYLIGSYYYPGYGAIRQWQQMAVSAPWTKPVLGYYDEGNPECIDWQIKWAVEHGVNFFLVDWYWQAGHMHNLHYLEGFYQARFRKYFKWAIMWANHNAPDTHSRKDWVNVVNYWIEHYLKTPEYLTLHGKPVVFMWSPSNLARDMGGADKAAKLIKLADDMAREAGLPGLLFYSLNHSPDATLASQGYVGSTSYHWWSNAAISSQNRRFYSYQAVLDNAWDNWCKTGEKARQNHLEFLPVGDTGWDARPRHGLDTHVIYGRTPARFKRHLTDLKKWMDGRKQKIAVLGPWNEWTEGSYIEPCSEWGFEMLDAVRDVFCKDTTPAVDLTPTDIQRGPFDFDLALKMMNMTEWPFQQERKLFNWRMLMGINRLELTPEGLSGASSTRDPAIVTGPMSFPARKYQAAEVEMSISPAPEDAQQYLALFWSTTDAPISGESTQTVKLKPTDKMVKYTIPLAGHPRWNGIVTSLRFDPIQQQGKTFIIKSLKLVE